MEAGSFSKILLIIYKEGEHCAPEESNLYQHYCENIRSHWSCEGLLALMWSMSKSDAYYSNKSVSVMGYYEVEWEM
jgi:hypothetical protein